MTSAGKIHGALLVLNVQSGATASITTASSTLVNIILTHEIGHCLGLGHSSDTQALMYYATNSSRLPVLAKDDIDGVTFLYPRQEPSAGGLMGCGTLKDIGNKPQKGFYSKENTPKPIQSQSTRFNVEILFLIALCFLGVRVTRKTTRDILL